MACVKRINTLAFSLSLTKVDSFDEIDFVIVTWSDILVDQKNQSLSKVIKTFGNDGEMIFVDLVGFETELALVLPAFWTAELNVLVVQSSHWSLVFEAGV